MDEAEWAGFKVPHVGWNTVRAARPSTLLCDVAPDAQAYFTHSYAAPVGPCTVATTTHGPGDVCERGRARPACSACSSIPRNRPTPGLTMLRNFLARTRGDRRRRRRAGGAASRAPQVASKRIIACLDVRDGGVVKGVKFEGLRHAGDPAELAARYNVEGIDEVVILDVTATLESRRALARTIADVARRLFIPLAVGGGIRTEDDAAAVVDAGADKVSLNTAALVDPDLDHAPRRPLRQPGGGRRDRREAARATASRSTRAAAARTPRARRSSGRRKRRRAAPARFC